MTLNTQRIETLMAEQGMTQKTLSDRCGISRQSISTIICRGTAVPKSVGKLAAVLGVPVAEILAKET